MKKTIIFNRSVTISTRLGPDVQYSVYNKIIETNVRYLGWEKDKLANLATSKQKSVHLMALFLLITESNAILHYTFFLLFNCLFRSSQTSCMSELISSELITNMDLVIASLLEFNICLPVIEQESQPCIVQHSSKGLRRVS